MHARRFCYFSVLLSLFASPVAYSQTAEENRAATPAVTGPAVGQGARGRTEEGRLIANRVNNFRHRHGRRPLAVNPELEKTAEYFARFMARTDTYGHTADGRRPAQRALQRGYEYCIVAENIATLYNSAGFTREELARQLFRGWKRSPGHRQNMLDPAVVDTGIAVAQSDQTGRYYAVQMFGRPQAQAIEFQISNHTHVPVAYEVGGRTFPLPPRATRTHQRCRPASLAFHWPGAQQHTTLQPDNGTRYTIVRKDSHEFRVKADEGAHVARAESDHRRFVHAITP
jgi:uncharacterized protein YkwD